MKLPAAIAFSLGLFATLLVVSEFIGFDLVTVMVVGTALWVAFDSAKLELRRYESGVDYGPVAIFILSTLVWIVAFPWYLAMRHKIQTGTAVLKEAAPAPASGAATA